MRQLTHFPVCLLRLDSIACLVVCSQVAQREKEFHKKQKSKERTTLTPASSERAAKRPRGRSYQPVKPVVWCSAPLELCARDAGPDPVPVPVEVQCYPAAPDTPLTEGVIICG